jgi:hypothetical protein
MRYLLPMHVAGADRADQCLAATPAQREDEKDVTPGCTRPDRVKPFFLLRMIGIRKDRDRPQENRLNVGNPNAVFTAFFAIAVVSIEACHDIHGAKMSIVHTFVNLVIGSGQIIRIVEHAAEKVA